MSRNLFTAAVIAVLAVVAITVSAAAASQAAGPSTATSTTLVFFVKFSPFTIIESNTDNPEAPIVALGDENINHGQLFSHGQHVGESFNSCVAVTAPPATIVGNCGVVFRLPGGDITGQYATGPGGAPKPIALTGGTGIYNSAGGEGTLVEHGNGTGSLTLHVLTLGPQGEEA